MMLCSDSAIDTLAGDKNHIIEWIDTNASFVLLLVPKLRYLSNPLLLFPATKKSRTLLLCHIYIVINNIEGQIIAVP